MYWRRVYLTILFLLLIITLMVLLWFFNNKAVNTSGFGIYLVDNNELIISEQDVIYYNWSSHKLKLTNEGIEKIESLDIPLKGRPFVIRIGSQEIYNGSFYSPISSIPYRGIIIEAFVRDGTIAIEHGYPPVENEVGDPRKNQAILNYFERLGKVKT